MRRQWIYAHEPLLKKEGKTQGAWDGGLLFPAAALLTRAHEHRIYFEARDGSRHHEERFAGKSPCRIGTSAWQRGRLVGVRVADPKLNGTLLTKAFRLDGPRLLLDVDVSAAGSSVSVEVLRVDHEDGTVLSGSQRQHSIPIVAPADGQTEALWLVRSADSTPFPSGAQPQPVGAAQRRRAQRSRVRRLAFEPPLNDEDDKDKGCSRPPARRTRARAEIAREMYRDGRLHSKMQVDRAGPWPPLTS